MSQLPTTPAVHVDDPALEGGEWLFQREGQVYGPVDGRRLATLIYGGELGSASPVSSGDGRWQPVGQVPRFMVHVKRAEAALRVEREVTGARSLRARQARTRTAGLALGAMALVGGAGALALWLGRGGERSPLLDDLGGGISIAVAARVDVADAGEVEVEVVPDAPERRPGGATARRPSSSAVAPGPGSDLVATSFHAGRIQDGVSRQQRTLAPCLRAEAARNPDLGGEVSLEFTIGNEGRVVRVVVPDPRLRQGPLRDCFEQVLSGWSFDRFPGQRPSVALVFKVAR